MSNKYLREIEEILRQAGEQGSAKGRRQKKSPAEAEDSQWHNPLRMRWWPISPGHIALIAGCVLLSAIVLRAMASRVAIPLFWAALVLFVAAYAVFLARPALHEKRWRGRPVEDNGPSWRERLRKRLGR